MTESYVNKNQTSLLLKTLKFKYIVIVRIFEGKYNSIKIFWFRNIFSVRMQEVQIIKGGKPSSTKSFNEIKTQSQTRPDVMRIILLFFVLAL